MKIWNLLNNHMSLHLRTPHGRSQGCQIGFVEANNRDGRKAGPTGEEIRARGSTFFTRLPTISSSAFLLHRHYILYRSTAVSGPWLKSKCWLSAWSLQTLIARFLFLVIKPRTWWSRGLQYYYYSRSNVYDFYRLN